MYSIRIQEGKIPVKSGLNFILCFCLASIASAQGLITTVAGGGTWIFPVGPVAAGQAPLGRVTAVATDTAGNVYAGDLENHQVVRISPEGQLTVLAAIDSPASLAVDPSGNLFVLDIIPGGGVGTIRKIDPSGAGSVVPDGGLSRPNGLAVDISGNLYIADSGENRIRKITPGGAISTVAGKEGDISCGFSGDGGPATAASFCDPYGVVVDGNGNLYISEAGNSRIRKVGTDGIIKTIAGNGNRGYSGDGGPATQAMLSWPWGMAVDSAGNLYFADWQNQRVRKVSAGGTITTLAGNSTINFPGDGGPASTSTLNNPQSVALDSSGNLYVADTGNSRVRKIDATGNITTFAGNGMFKVAGDGGPATAAVFNSPSAVVVDRDGTLYVADSLAHRVRKISPGGTVTTVAGRGLGFAGDGGPATLALLNSPLQLALDSLGNLYIADSGNNRIRKVTPQGIITTVAGGGTGADPGDGGPATSAVLRSPGGVAVDTAGNLYIADALNFRVRKVDASGVISTLAAVFQFPARLAVDISGNVYASFQALGIARRDGGVTKITPAGQTTSAAHGLIRPFGLAVDQSGTLFVTESFDNLVLKAAADGSTTPVAGTGMAGFSGDGGPATSATLTNPSGLAVDSSGFLYIADSGNARIRRVSGPGCNGSPEPTLTMTLQPGFYIAEVRNAPGTPEGYWGMSAHVDLGDLPGGFNLGGGLRENGGPPGYGAFYVTANQKVTMHVDAEVIPGGDPSRFSMSIHLLDANRQQIGTDQIGTTSVQFDQTLSPGFYIMAVYPGGSAPRAVFQSSVITDSLSGGANAGGFVSQGLVGFGAFYVPETQDVKLQLFGLSNGADGARCLQLTLLDSNRKVVATAP